MIEKLYTVEEVAELASVTGRTIRNYLKSGRLVGRKIGGQWRFPETEVQRLLTGADAEEEADTPVEPAREEAAPEEAPAYAAPATEAPAPAPHYIPSAPPAAEAAPVYADYNEPAPLPMPSAPEFTPKTAEYRPPVASSEKAQPVVSAEASPRPAPAMMREEAPAAHAPAYSAEPAPEPYSVPQPGGFYAESNRPAPLSVPPAAQAPAHAQPVPVPAPVPQAHQPAALPHQPEPAPAYSPAPVTNEQAPYYTPQGQAPAPEAAPAPVYQPPAKPEPAPAPAPASPAAEFSSQVYNQPGQANPYAAQPSPAEPTAAGYQQEPYPFPVPSPYSPQQAAVPPGYPLPYLNPQNYPTLYGQQMPMPYFSGMVPQAPANQEPELDVSDEEEALKPRKKNKKKLKVKSLNAPEQELVEEAPAPAAVVPEAKPSAPALPNLSDVGKRIFEFIAEVHDYSQGPQICSVVDMHQSLTAAKKTSAQLTNIALDESQAGILCQCFVEYDERYYVARYTLFGTTQFLTRCLKLVG